MKKWIWLPLLGLGAALYLSSSQEPEDLLTESPATQDAEAPPLRPVPTEHWLEEDAEESNKSRRKAWQAFMHRAPPGVDWKEVERQNGLDLLERRRQLAAAPPATLTSAWVERGSDNQAGRVHVARHSPSGEEIYLGSSKGGVWRGALDGSAWEPIGDGLYGGSHWLEVLSPPEVGAEPVVLAGTDWGFIHRSEDAGETWEVPAGLGSPTALRRSWMSRDGEERVFLLTVESDGVRLRRSEDGVQSFETVLESGSFQGDFWSPTLSPGPIYIVTGEGLQRSEDHGESWERISELPRAASRAELTGSEAGAPDLWMVLDGVRLYRSRDAGVSWQLLSSIDDYWGTLAASTEDPDLFVYGGMELHVSRDGGSSFRDQNDWWDYYDDPDRYLHADMMGIDVLPDPEGGSEIWYINTDGGLYRSQDALSSVSNLALRGLRVSQYYDTHTSAVNPENVIGGSQDQGYQVTALETQEEGEEVWRFSQIISGDYGHITSSDGSQEVVYSVYPGFILLQVGEESPTLGSIDFPANETYVPWMPPILADPENAWGLFFPARQLYYIERRGNRWVTEPWSDHEFSLSSGEYISAVAAAPSDSSHMAVATSAGRVWFSVDRGETWTQSQSLAPSGHYLYGQALSYHQEDPQILVLGGSGYGNPPVYRSEDGGISFRPWSEGLPDTMVYSLAQAPDGSDTWFAGSESAAWRRDEGGEWYDITAPSAPITTYWSAESLRHENTIRFGTYGRGIWDYQIDSEGVGCFPVQDYDEDGVSCDLDCDDQDPSVFPGAEELCDGLDQNCDPQDLDEEDRDGDGAPACADCDDEAPLRFPGAEEICGDGVDQDCDGEDAPCPESDSGEEETEPEPEEETEPPRSESPRELDSAEEGCGCGQPAGSLTWSWLLPLLWLGRRRAG